MEEAKLIVHNLPTDFSTERLYDIFGSYGEIVEGEFKWGIGFIGFTFSESAEDAFVGMNGTKIEGKAIKIDFPGRKLPVSRLIVKNLPTSDYSSEELKELFSTYGDISECDYKWGYGFLKFKEEEALKKSMKELKGTEIVPGRKIYFELQGPNGEAASKTDAAGEDRNGSIEEIDGKSVHGLIGPVRLFLGNLLDGTTEDEVREVVEPLGEVRKVDVKGNFGFVHFKLPAACRQALSVLATKVINGNNPRVQLAEIKKGGKVFVGGLNEDIDQDELITMFLAKGSVVEYKFVKKFAFFTFDDVGDARSAVSSLNGKSLGDCTLKVAISTADRALSNGDPDACHSCGGHGHISRFCPIDRKDACHKCGMTGHWAKECPGSSGGGSRIRSRSPAPSRRDPYGSDGRGQSGYPDMYPRSGSRR